MSQRSIEGERPSVKPKTDTHFASNRTQELMFQIGQWRESRGLDPQPEQLTYRREGLRQREMQPGEDYPIG